MDISENYLTIHMEVELLSTLKMGKTILMTPNVLEICFQQTATFQKQTYFLIKPLLIGFRKCPQGPSCSLFNSLRVSQVPSRFLKFFQKQFLKFPQGFSSSFKQFLKFPQGLSGPSGSLKVPQGLSGSLKMSQGHHGLKKLIKPQGITSQQDGTHTSLRASALYHKHFDMICFHIVYPSKNRVVLWSQFQIFSKIQGRTLTKKMKIKGRSLIETKS